jgi:hypothetical protein
MKQILLLIALLIGYNSFSQTTIYSENCGTPSATTSVATYTGWQNYATLTYVGNADVRTTVPSTTYAGASGNGNIFITNTLNTNCTISGINTANYNSICLQFGILKTANGSNGSNLAVEYSTDGTTWVALSFTLGTGSGSSNVWTYIQPTCSACGTAGLPSTSNLRIRFRMASLMTGLQFRIDDIKITGTYSGVVLPLTITKFNVFNNGTKNTLHWTTLSEDGVSMFVVEKSTDLQNWKGITEILAVGDLFSKREYEYVDNGVEVTINYYRLHVYEETDDYYSNVVGVITHINPNPIRYYELNGTEVDGKLKSNKVYIKVENNSPTKIFFLED